MTETDVTCSRCIRCPRDEDDLAAWTTIEGENVCPGCLTMAEAEALRDPAA